MQSGDNVVVTKLTPKNRRFTAHSHDEYVISVNGPEVLTEQVRLDGRELSVGTDEITVYNPGQIQASLAHTEQKVPWECFSIHVSPSVVSQLIGVDSFEAQKPLVKAPYLSQFLRNAHYQDEKTMDSSAQPV